MNIKYIYILTVDRIRISNIFVVRKKTEYEYRIYSFLAIWLNTNIEYICNQKIKYSYSNIYYSVPNIRIFEYIRVTLVGCNFICLFCPICSVLFCSVLFYSVIFCYVLFCSLFCSILFCFRHCFFALLYNIICFVVFLCSVLGFVQRDLKASNRIKSVL